MQPDAPGSLRELSSTTETDGADRAPRDRDVAADAQRRPEGAPRPRGRVGLGRPSRPAPRRRDGPARVVPEPARSYPHARGRTRMRAVVPACARSYLRSLLRYDLAQQSTTAGPDIRPRGTEGVEPAASAHAPPTRTARATRTAQGVQEAVQDARAQSTWQMRGLRPPRSRTGWSPSRRRRPL